MQRRLRESVSEHSAICPHLSFSAGTEIATAIHSALRQQLDIDLLSSSTSRRPKGRRETTPQRRQGRAPSASINFGTLGTGSNSVLHLHHTTFAAYSSGDKLMMGLRNIMCKPLLPSHTLAQSSPVRPSWLVGYAADHPEIELLKLRNYTLGTKIHNEQILGAGGMDFVLKLMTCMKPFVTYLNSVVMPDERDTDESDEGEGEIGNDDDGNDDSDDEIRG
nr:hypothetical protein CFP56_24626 [Quercus suber]